MEEVVSRALFMKEVAGLQAFHQAELPGYDLTILNAQYPVVLIRIHYPGRPDLVLRIEASNWPQEPASYLFVEPTAPSNILPAERWPGQPFPIVPELNMKGHHNGPFRDDHTRWRDRIPGHRGQVQQAPWICLEGTREYHSSYQHFRNRWSAIQTRANCSFAAMAYAIQQQVFAVCGVTPVASAT